MATHDTAHGGHGHGAAHAHVQHPPLSLYFSTFAWLMVLLILTLVAAAINLGELNLIIAITIAVIKAVLVLWNFMHLRYGTRLVKVFAGAALFWLVILFCLTLGDYFARRGPAAPATAPAPPAAASEAP